MSGGRYQKKLKTKEEKLVYIGDRIDQSKITMTALEEKADALADEAEQMVAIKNEKAAELARHVDGDSEDEEMEGEKNALLRSALQLAVGAIEDVAALEGMQADRLRNVRLNLESYPGQCRRAYLQRDEFEAADTNLEDAKKHTAAAKGRKKIMHEATLEGLRTLQQRAEDALVREAQEHENMRVAMLTKALGDFCHLNIEYHARTLAKFVEVDAAIRELQVAPSEIEDDVGLMESRAASANCNLYRKMVGALEEKQLAPEEEQKERKKIEEMFFSGSDPLFEEA